MPVTRPSYWLRPTIVLRVLDQRGWSQEGLASDIGISRVSLSRYLHRHRPVGLRSRRRLAAWATSNGIAPDALLERRFSG